jgi:hypothetical protein
MHLFRLMVTVSVFDAALAACTEPVEMTAETAQAIDGPCDGGNDFDCRCSGCSANGVTQRQWDGMFSEADRNALNDFGTWAANGDGPVRLCASAPAANHTECTLHPAWHDWLWAGTDRRIGMITGIVKVVARKGFRVRDPGGNTYHGAFGLAHEALGETPWTYRSQELLVAGMLALIDAVHGVPVCLRSTHTPDNCAGLTDMDFESITFGSTFRMHYAAIAGGSDAPDPAKNRRYSTVLPTSATKFVWPPPCTVAGNGANALATHCTDELGRPWRWPVTVMVPFVPRSWYYDVGGGPIERPDGVPQTR